MADKTTTRIDLGFQGGQVLSLRLQSDRFGALKKVLEKGSDRWHEIEGEDSTVTVDLGQIVYIRIDNDAVKVGF